MESGRTTDIRGRFWIWAGANIAPINRVLGALGVTMGPGLWETIAVLAVGNLIGMSLFGIFVVIGQRTRQHRTRPAERGGYRHHGHPGGDRLVRPPGDRGVDLSWLAGGIAAASTYLALEAIRGRQLQK